MWVWLIILLAVAMVVGPIFMIRPSKQQQKLAKLRTAASSAGLVVKVASSESAELKGAYYTLPISKKKSQKYASWCLRKGSYSHEAHFHGRWDWDGKDRAEEFRLSKIERFLETLPESFTAFGVNPMGIYLLWDERYDEGEEKNAINNIQDRLTMAAEHLELNGPSQRN